MGSTVSIEPNITIAETARECEQAINDLKRHYEFQAFPVLGFDCEWVSFSGPRRKVALLQLAAINGECVLIRLFKLEYIPENLKRILRTDSILKVGVTPVDDAQKLLQDYGITVHGALDLRFLAEKYIPNPGGLEDLAWNYAGVALEKDWTVRAFNWEAPSLPANQVNYAAMDAQVAVSIFKKLASLLWPQTLNANNWVTIFGYCDEYVDRRYGYIFNG